MKKNIIEFNDEKFNESSYNGISVIIDSNGYYQASKICRDNNKEFKHWMENKSTIELLNIYAEILNLSIKPVGRNSDLPLTSVLLYKRGPTYDNFIRGYYIHPKLVNALCMWCNLRYAVIVNEIMDMMNEELHLRNITLENKMKEMNINIEKLKIEKEVLTNENLSKQKIIDDLKTRSVPKEECVRYLYILKTDTGFRLSGDSNTRFPSRIIYAKYQFSASMNYRKCFTNLCNNQYYHFDENKLEEIIDLIQSYDPIVIINPIP